MLRWLRLLTPSHGLGPAVGRVGPAVGRAGRPKCCWRGLADAHRPDSTSKPTAKQVVAQGADSMPGLRIRRARPADVPRVLRFVREHARAAWPHAPTPAPRDAVSLVIADYVSRALAQGHTLLAEQADGRRGWLTLRGLALGARVCPWDARLLERCARCVRCARARRTLHFAAHCLRAPKLHDKYHVHNILQVLMIVPEEQATPSLVRPLLQAAMQQATDSGIPMIRVDVTSSEIAKILEELQFKKEWYMEYQVISEAIAERDSEGGAGGKGVTEAAGGPDQSPVPRHFVAVYSNGADKKLEAAAVKP